MTIGQGRCWQYLMMTLVAIRHTDDADDDNRWEWRCMWRQWRCAGAGSTRGMSQRHMRSASSLHTVRVSDTRASTLPPGSRLDPKAFMGMDTSDSGQSSSVACTPVEIVCVHPDNVEPIIIQRGTWSLYTPRQCRVYIHPDNVGSIIIQQGTWSLYTPRQCRVYIHPDDVEFIYTQTI